MRAKAQKEKRTTSLHGGIYYTQDSKKKKKIIGEKNISLLYARFRL